MQLQSRRRLRLRHLHSPAGVQQQHGGVSMKRVCRAGGGGGGVGGRWRCCTTCMSGDNSGDKLFSGWSSKARLNIMSVMRPTAAVAG